MPPVPQPSNENTTAFDGHHFTHDDVQVLFDIVDAAEKSPRANLQPYSALFNAYEEVLARYGLRTELDQIYFRVLFRIGELHGSTQSLATALEVFLKERDIKLVLGSDGPDDTSYSGEPEEAVEEAEDATADPPFSPRPRRERRASFSSFVEAEEQSAKIGRGRADSTGSLSRLQDHSEGFGSRPFKVLEPRSKEEVDAPDVRDRGERARHLSRRIGQIERNGGHNSHRRHQSVQASGLIPAARNPPRNLDYGWGGSRQRGAAPSFTIYEDARSPEEQSVAAGTPGDEPSLDLQYRHWHRPSDAQRLRDAETFDDFRIRNLARNVLRYWRRQAQRECDRHDQWLRKAIVFDRRILLCQTLEVWSAALQRLTEERDEARRVQELEQFYDSLEARADQVYDVFLLSKAITHWAQCAADEVESKNLARAHILRLRYFNAWRETTAVNQLKIRKYVLQKFLGLWRRRLTQTTDDQERSLILYQGNIVEKIYRKWFWAVCERRIEEWRGIRLKQLHLIRWGLRLRQNLNRSLCVRNLRDGEIQRRYVSRWQQKTEVARMAQQEAVNFRQRQLVARCLPQWERQLRYAPAARQVQGMMQWRIVSSIFSTIQLRLQQALQAELVSRRRLARNAWTLWNDRLRWQTLLHQVHDRFATQALYRWIIAERLVLMRRLCEERIRVNVFGMLVQRWQQLAARNEEAVKAVGRLRDRSLLRDVLSEWTGKLHRQRQRDAMAFEYFAPKLRQDAMQSWHAKYETQIQLERWSVEAVYYFRATRALRALQAAMVLSRKQKRRDAYVQVRRRLKMNLARECLLQWHRKATRAAALNHRAADFVAKRSSETSFSIVHLWYDRLSLAREHLYLAEQQDEKRLSALALGQWTNRLHDAERDSQAATNFGRLRKEKAAFDCLRRLQLRSLEHQALAAKANTVFSWSNRRRVRYLVREWADRAIEQRTGRKPMPQNLSAAKYHGRDPALRRRTPFPDPENILATISPPHPPFSPPPSNPSILTGNHSPLQELNQAIPLPNLAAVTPLPGYLSTPSKRAERARALVPLDRESFRSVGQGPAVESFTPATGGLRTLRRSLLGRSVPYAAAPNAPVGGTIFEDTDEGHRHGATDGDGEEDDSTLANEGPATGSARVDDGVRRSLFSRSNESKGKGG